MAPEDQVLFGMGVSHWEESDYSCAQCGTFLECLKDGLGKIKATHCPGCGFTVWQTKEK